MPYVVTQGDINTALENAFNFGHNERTAVRVRLDTLHDLLDGKPVGSCGSFLSTDISNHIDKHWFGLTNERAWWLNWKGPAQDIARRGMTVGLALSLGLSTEISATDVKAHLDTAGVNLHAHWLDFVWVCPVPRFEFWVSWRETDAATGDRVFTVTMATPGPGSYEPPEEAPPLLPGSDGKLKAALPNDYAGLGAANGHIVVGSALSKTTTTIVKLPAVPLLGDYCWAIALVPTTEATGGVVVHKPPPTDGIPDDAAVADSAYSEVPR